MSPFLKIATLDDDELARVRAMEDQYGLHIMAFEPGPRIAALSDGQVREIKQLEEELGVTLLAFEF